MSLIIGLLFMILKKNAKNAKNDLRLIQKLRSYKMYDNAIASPVLEVMDRHTDYLRCLTLLLLLVYFSFSTVFL